MARYPRATLGLTLLCALSSGAWAQTSSPAPAAADRPAVHVKTSVHKKPASSAVKTTAPDADRSDRAAALARERRNFFAHDKTDSSDSDADPSGGPGGSGGAFLGGGSGLTPGMQFKF